MPWQESCSVTAMGGSLVRIIFIGMRIFSIRTIMIVHGIANSAKLLSENTFKDIKEKSYFESN